MHSNLCSTPRTDGCISRSSATGSSACRTDGDAGLIHVGARYYDAQVGRFNTRDTVLSEHPYLYCEHDPVNAVDPKGTWGLTIGFGGSLIAPGFGGFVDVGIVIADDGVHFTGHAGGSGNGHGIGFSIGPQLSWTPGKIKDGPDNGYWIGGFAGWVTGAGLQVAFDPRAELGGFTIAPPTPLPTYGAGAASGTFIGWMSKAFPLQYGSDYMF